MDRFNFFFRQKVTEKELDDAFAAVERSLWNHRLDEAAGGVIFQGLQLVAALNPNMTVTVVAGVAYDKQGRRCFVPAEVSLNAAKDSENLLTSVQTPGNARWLSVYLTFAREASIPRIDGKGDQVFYYQAEGYELHVVQGVEAAIGTAKYPDPVPDGILLGDVRLLHGMTIVTNGDISLLRRDEYKTATDLARILKPIEKTVTELDATKVKSPEIPGVLAASNVHAQLVGLATRADQANSDRRSEITTLRNDHTALRNDHSGVASRVTTIEGQLADTNSDVSQANADTSQLRQDLQALDGRVTTLATNTGSSFQAVNQSIASLNNKHDAQDDFLSSHAGLLDNHAFRIGKIEARKWTKVAGGLFSREDMLSWVSDPPDLVLEAGDLVAIYAGGVFAIDNTKLGAELFAGTSEMSSGMYWGNSSFQVGSFGCLYDAGTDRLRIRSFNKMSLHETVRGLAVCIWPRTIRPSFEVFRVTS